MPGAAFDYSKRMTAFSKIVFDFAVLRRLWVGKIRRNNAAHGAYKLVHHAAGLAEMQVFRLLCKLRNGLGLELIVVVQAVEYACDEHGERRRGAQPRAGA